MPPTDRTREHGLTLALIGPLTLGFVLRFSVTWFGSPYLFHNDDDFEVIRALQLGTGQYDFARIGKGGYFFLLFVE